MLFYKLVVLFLIFALCAVVAFDTIAIWLILTR